ncbi:thiosulfate:glutathione sulfurtransferase [Fundulus heteroclitus]|uniref:thiosulfate:glutathione sulfurtransferase n=1 Tax=Fundulus heteroclitus TaxID=8078 RepID=UPI00165A20B4|nr:thiosulfate:glutathione sulfurtransferase [Fundulus heteroclitus]
MAGTIKYEELKALLAQSGGLVLIDVRGDDEVRGGRIPGSIHIPLSMLDNALSLSPAEFKARYNATKPAPDTPKLVFYCQSGRRGEMAAHKAHRHGYINVYNYAGAYSEWSRREPKQL